jgi:hypothetical protein
MSGLKHSFIESFIEQNPDVKICFCVDNDEAGKNFIADMNSRFPDKTLYCSRELESKGVKDYNDLLQSLVNEKTVEKSQTVNAERG